MDLPATTLGHIEKLYGAGLDSSLWYASLQALAEDVGAAGCLLNPEKSGSLLGLRPSTELTDVLAGFVAGEWHLRDHRSERGWARVRRGQSVILEHDIANDEERRMRPFYREWAEPSGLPWWAAIGFRVGAEYWSMPLLRSARQGPFTREEAARLAALVPHLERVVDFAQRLARGRTEGRLEVLERLGCGCFVLDWRGKCVRHNAAAEAVLGRDLYLRAGRLAARDRASDERLQALVDRIVSGESATSAARVAVRRETTAPLLVDGMHVSCGIAELFFDCTAILMVENARPREVLQTGEIRDAFGLSHAEARLAAALSTGRDITQAALQLGIGRETARTQLKSIFQKTGLRRQAELAALLAAFRR